jgi:hypothetical protein
VINGDIPRIGTRMVSVAILEMTICPSGISCWVAAGFFSGVFVVVSVTLVPVTVAEVVLAGAFFATFLAGAAVSVMLVVPFMVGQGPPVAHTRGPCSWSYATSRTCCRHGRRFDGLAMRRTASSSC